MPMVNMLWSVVVLLLGVIGTSGVCAQKPGFQTRITQHALDYANQRALDSLAEMIQKAKIPDQSGSSGHLQYSLTNIRITGFTKPSSSIKLKPSKGLSWSANGAGISLHSDWRVRYKKGFVKFSTSGSVDVSVSGVVFSVDITFGADSSGRLSIKSAGCSCSIGGVSIDFHGKLSFLLDLFRHEVEKRVRSMLPGKICDAVNEEINVNAEDALKKVKVKTPLLDNRFTLDYSLVAPPSFQAAYMETYHKGEITWTADPKAPPFPPSPLPPSPSSSSMLYLWVGEYVPQSFIYAAQQHGFLAYNLTSKDLPPDQRGFLNTTCTSLTCIGLLMPTVGKKYPHCTVELRMNSTMTPVVNMWPNKLESRAAGEIALYAVGPAKPPAYLMTLGVSAVFNMTATVDSQLIKGNITGSSFKVKTLKVDPDIGPIKDKVINTMMNFAMKFFIIPSINKQGNHGFPLPVTDDVKFVKTQLQIQQGALMIGTDVVYNPQFHFH